MRPSLLPGLARAAARNLSRGATSVRLFELGRRYLADAERPTLSLLMAGEAEPRGWQSGKARAFQPYDVKAAVTALLGDAGAEFAQFCSSRGDVSADAGTNLDLAAQELGADAAGKARRTGGHHGLGNVRERPALTADDQVFLLDTKSEVRLGVHVV